MKKNQKIRIEVTIVLAVFALLYYIHFQNYLLFHSFVEMFSIVIAFAIFIIAWNSRKFMKGRYLLILGVAYLFIGFLDLMHTLGYKGMQIFKDYDYYANQLWIAARFLEAISIVIAFFFIGSTRQIKPGLLWTAYSVSALFIIYSIFFSDLFPVCYIEGKGQTVFKIVAEYIINGILVFGLTILYKKRKKVSPGLFSMLVASICFTILSELAFTFYTSNYGFSNMLGHCGKIISFYFIYKATVVRSISEPFNTIFAELSAMNNQKSELFAIIAHDLRGPLSGIVNISENLVKYHKNFSEEERKEIFSEIYKASSSTMDLVLNLLYWAKAEQESGALEFTSVSVDDLVEEAVSALDLVYKSKNISIKTDLEKDLQITVDRNTIEIVLRNILSNAYKFSNSGSAVSIRAYTGEKCKIIEISDEGIGMETEMIQSDAIRNKSMVGTNGEKGAGLGLSLVHSFSKKNKADMSVESKKGKGTTIRLRFDCSDA